MIKGVDHIGIAVSDIDEMLDFLKEVFAAEEYKRTEYPELQQISSIVMLKGTTFDSYSQQARMDPSVSL